MVLRTQQFIERMLIKAEYRFDESVKEWAGWIKGMPGIYVQAKDLESARNQLAEVLEEYLFASFQEKKKVKGFDIKIHSYAKAC